MEKDQYKTMIFFYIIQNVSHGNIHFVESTISGYCIFTKYESRAKLFTEQEANELAQHLQIHRPKNHYAKIQAHLPDHDPEVCFKTKSEQTSNNGTHPESEKERSSNAR